MLVAPRKNQRSSRTTALKLTFLVVKKRKALTQIILGLQAKYGQCPGPGAIGAFFSVFQNMIDEVNDTAS